MTWKGSFSSFVLMVFAVSWVGCETLPPPVPYVCEDDVILLGDTLTISLQGIPDPPPEGLYVVRADGTVNMYRLGVMPAAGKKLSEFEHEAAEAYIKRDLYKQITVILRKQGIVSTPWRAR
jgi:protein involved in polysaccharide export with SLBB domain